MAWPYGNRLTDAGPAASLPYFSLDLAEITRVRSRWPYLEDVRAGKP
ncbi:MAG TPA: hypothetical protein VMW83_13295 [Spirochaetia bacterium]|nr:hypothetical protein [Spirochaetia bacterium]